MGNIILKTFLRRPIRMLLCMVMMGVTVFAFLSNVCEYYLIDKQIDKSAQYYQQVGMLEVIGTDNSNSDELDPSCIEQIADSSYVAYINQMSTYRAEIPEFVTADNGELGACYGINSLYLQGTVMEKEKNVSTLGEPYRVVWADEAFEEKAVIDYDYVDSIRMEINGVVAGHPDLTEVLWEMDVLLMMEDQEEQAALFDSIEIGKNYFFKVERNDGGAGLDSSSYVLRPLEGIDSWVYEMGEGETVDLSEPVFADCKLAIDRLEEDLHIFLANVAKNMKALPGMDDIYYLQDGRYLTYEDTLQKNAVCVIRSEFARHSRLKVGDTIEMTVGQDMTEVRHRFLALDDDTRWNNWAAAEKETLELEVVGILANIDTSYTENVDSINVYLPSSCLPESWQQNETVPTEDTFSFVLNSPDDREAFLLENEDMLNAAGLEVVFLDNGWDAYKASAEEMKAGWLLGMVAFGVVTVIVMCLVILIVLTTCRRERAILRATGVAKKDVQRQTVIPVFLGGGLAVFLGGIAGYIYALHMANHVLSELGQEIADSLSAPLILPGGIIVIIILIFIGGFFVCESQNGKIPVLEQLQGSRHQKTGRKHRK